MQKREGIKTFIHTDIKHRVKNHNELFYFLQSYKNVSEQLVAFKQKDVELKELLSILSMNGFITLQKFELSPTEHKANLDTILQHKIGNEMGVKVVLKDCFCIKELDVKEKDRLKKTAIFAIFGE